MLSQKKKEILNILSNNPEITLAEIGKQIGLNSTSSVHAHVNKLVELGYLKKFGRKFIVKSDDAELVKNLPYFGYAQCGYNGIFNEDEVLDYIPFPTRFLPKNTEDLVVMKAKGTSMEPTIEEDELLIFDKSKRYEEPTLNDILLCSLGGEIKIKRFTIRQGIPMLISDNKSMFEPIELDETRQLTIIGKLVKMRA